MFSFKKICNKIKSFFITDEIIEDPSEKNRNTKTYVDHRTGVEVNSSLVKTINNKRFLQLDDRTCALIIHPNFVYEAILTKYTADNQNFTEEEILLMSLVIHLKKDGFSEMLVSELNRIALKNDSLFKNNNTQNNG